MMTAEAYLGRSRLFQRLKSGPHGQLIERYAARLIEDGLVRGGVWRCLNVVGGLLIWIASSRTRLADLDECRIERYLRHRGSSQTIQRGDRAALRRWLSMLRDPGVIAPPPVPNSTPQEQIFAEFDNYNICEGSAAYPRSPSPVICLSSASSCVKCALPAPATSARSVRKP